jgi:origin recognition complex subunit 1
MYVEVNAMKLSHPYQLYTTLWNAIARRSERASGGAIKRRKGAKTLPQTSSTQRAVALLDEYFSKRDAGRVPVVLLVDELDYLVTRKQTVLYNIFEWPTRPQSALAVVGVANTMDLPERMLPKVHSRLGMGRLVFQPYTREQIRVIVNGRLGALGVFDPKAVELASRKVAAISGDIRRALQMCRSAASIARGRWEAAAAASPAARAAVKVCAADINTAARQLAASNTVASIKGCASLERLALLSAALCQRQATGEQLAGSAVVQRAATLRRTALGCSTDLPLQVWHGILLRLCDCKLLRGDSASAGLGGGAVELPAVRLNVQVDDVAFALKEDEELAEAAALLSA